MGLKELKERIQEKAKGVHISRLSDSDIASEKTYFPTPSLDLNRILSGSLYKGVPSRSFTLLVGPEASFKSSFMCLCLANAQKAGYMPVVFDTEGAWTSDFVSRWGLDPDNILYIYSPWVDDLMVAMGQIIAGDTVKEGNRKVTYRDEKLALAIDSIGGIEALKLIEDAEKGDVKADQGTLQKKIKRLLKMTVNICKGQNSVGFASGHYYGNPSGYGDPESIGGGKYARLAPDIIIGLKKSKIQDSDKNVTGNLIRAITLKNRFYPPFSEAYIEIDYKEGINTHAGLLPILLDAGIVVKTGNTYSCGDSKLGVGETNAINALPKFDSVVLPKLEEFIQKTGYFTINNEIKEAVELLEKVSNEVDIDDEDENDENEGINGNGRKKRMSKK